MQHGPIHNSFNSTKKQIATRNIRWIYRLNWYRCTKWITSMMMQHNRFCGHRWTSFDDANLIFIIRQRVTECSLLIITCFHSIGLGALADPTHAYILHIITSYQLKVESALTCRYHFKEKMRHFSWANWGEPEPWTMSLPYLANVFL